MISRKINRYISINRKPIKCILSKPHRPADKRGARCYIHYVTQLGSTFKNYT